MFVADWMTRKVTTVGPDDSISHAVRLMHERGIKHLPVLRDGAVIGVISDRDIKEFSPSKATTLDVYEINYLLSKATVKDAVARPLTVTTADTPIESAALAMFENNIGCLPVVEGQVLVGIISDRDIFRALVDITGVRHGGYRICVTVPDYAGSIREVTDIARQHGFDPISILSSHENMPKGARKVVIRTGAEGDFAAMQAAIVAAHPSARISRG